MHLLFILRLHVKSAAVFNDILYTCTCTCSVDATFSKRKGRYVNDGYGGQQNSVMKVIEVTSIPHLALFATQNIKKGEEICYDYGVLTLPWRKQVTDINSLDRFVL